MDKYHRKEANDICCIRRNESGFPEKLKMLSDCPKEIYVRGQLPDPQKKTVAIVGARMCSAYGRAVAAYFAEVLAENQIQIISGLALGVDGAAHEGTLKAGGTTYGVLAGGVDICYPRSHIDLYERVRKNGGIISEQPPGMPSLARLFPLRNRLISALSDLVLVVEARKRSGSLITADFACEQGKELYAVPGRLEDPLSEGCNELIAQGAGIALNPQHILEVLGKRQTKGKDNKKLTENFLAHRENIVYSCLSLQPKRLEQIQKEVNLSLTETIEIVMLLQLKGLIQENGRNQYTKIP